MPSRDELATDAAAVPVRVSTWRRDMGWLCALGIASPPVGGVRPRKLAPSTLKGS